MKTGMRALSRLAAAAAIALAGCGAFAQQVPGYDLGVVAPGNDATVFDDNGDVEVRVTVAPDLANGDQLELLLDGMPVAPPTMSLDYPLYGVMRGQHLLQARIIDATGNVGSISPPSTFYVWEASRLFPNRRGRG